MAPDKHSTAALHAQGFKKCFHTDIHLSLCIPVSTHRCFADVFRGLLTPVLCCCFDTLACTSPYTPVSTLQMFSHSCIHQSIVVVFLQLRTAVSTHRSLYTYAAHVKYMFAHVLSSDQSDDDHGDND